MKTQLRTLILALSALSLTSVFALDASNVAPGTDSTPAATTSTTTSNSSMTKMTKTSAKKADMKKEGEIIGLLIVLNKNEIAAANLALKKTTDPMVNKYAHLMIKDHTMNLKATMALSQHLHVAPVHTDAVLDLKKKGKDEAATLSEVDNKEFAEKYIDAMVKGHTDALSMIDDKISADHMSPSLLKHLQATRKHVAAHLEKAKAIQKQLSQSN